MPQTWRTLLPTTTTAILFSTNYMYFIKNDFNYILFIRFYTARAYFLDTYSTAYHTWKFLNIYIPVTVHREQSVKKEYQQDHVLLHMGFLLVVLDVAGCGAVVLRCRVWALWRLLFELQPSQWSHPQRSTTVPQPATSNTTSKYTPYAVTRGLFSWRWA